MLSFEMICAGEMPKPKHKSTCIEDPDPFPLPADVIAPSSLSFIQEIDGPVFSETSSVTSSSVIEGSKKKHNRRSYFNKKDTSEADRGFFELSEPVLNEE